jgi:cytochrome c peroxidase
VLFAKAFDTEEMTIDNTAKAIASFERNVISVNSPYDRYKQGDKTAMTPQQIRGMDVVDFTIRAGSKTKPGRKNQAAALDGSG